MKLFQQIAENASVPFTTSTTHMPTYDDMIKDPKYFREKKHKIFKIVHMSPNEYIERAAKGFGTHTKHVKKIIDNYYLEKSQSRRLIDEYSKKMQHGEKFPMPVLDHSSRYGFSGEKEKRFSQDGLHRAIAAKNIGTKKIPVMVVDDT